MNRLHKVFASVALAGALLFALSGCGLNKATEPYNDAPRGETNKGRADIITMPDGFSNLSTKCDHGNRVYVAFKGDLNRAAVAVIPGDPTCK